MKSALKPIFYPSSTKGEAKILPHKADENVIPDPNDLTGVGYISIT